MERQNIRRQGTEIRRTDESNYVLAPVRTHIEVAFLPQFSSRQSTATHRTNVCDNACDCLFASVRTYRCVEATIQLQASFRQSTAIRRTNVGEYVLDWTYRCVGQMFSSIIRPWNVQHMHNPPELHLCLGGKSLV